MVKKKLSLLFFVIFMLLVLISQNPMALNIEENTEQSGSSTPICDIRFFFYPEFNTTGNVTYAKDISIFGFHILEVMYYNASYGSVAVEGLFQTITYEMVLSISAYGFNGENNWDGTVEDTMGIQADGTACLLMVAHQG